jgi:1-acyl-sn-glycerol-3-phosphate acyltransferase
MNQFDDIRPYSDAEIAPIIDRLLKNKELLAVITRFRFPSLPKFLVTLMLPFVRFFVAKQVAQVKTVKDFQILIKSYLDRMLRETSSGLTVTGKRHLNTHKNYLFISNHRDIAVDPAIINLAIYECGFTTLQIATGDNLFTKSYVSDLMRINKSFIVNRSATKPREKFKAAQLLSAYICHVVTELKENLWIAQREGRAKNGIDKTNSAVIGMLALNKPKTVALSDYIHDLNIVPVSISYERDPCDIAKAKELYAHKEYGAYQKQEHEDAGSIARGITGFKGRIHVAFGEPLSGDFNSTDEVVAEIDKQVISNYVLQPSNCVAYQELYGSLPDNIVVTHQRLPFREDHFLTEIQKFRQHLAQCDEAYRDILLNMYANPIVCQQSQKSLQTAIQTTHQIT